MANPEARSPLRSILPPIVHATRDLAKRAKCKPGAEPPGDVTRGRRLRSARMASTWLARSKRAGTIPLTMGGALRCVGDRRSAARRVEGRLRYPCTMDIEIVKVVCQMLGPLAGAAIGAWAARWNSASESERRAKKESQDLLRELYVRWLVEVGNLVYQNPNLDLREYALANQRLALMDSDTRSRELRSCVIAAMPDGYEEDFDASESYPPFENAKDALLERLRERFAAK